jgi:hypothetical protein
MDDTTFLIRFAAFACPGTLLRFAGLIFLFGIREQISSREGVRFAWGCGDG